MKNSLVRVGFYLDSSHPKKDGSCNLKLRIFYKGKTKYIKTDISISPMVYDSITKSTKVPSKFKPLKFRMDDVLIKAKALVDELDHFTFHAFQNKYFSHDDGSLDLCSCFESKIKELDSNGQLSTMESYSNALSKLKRYFGKERIAFNEINPQVLTQINKWYLGNGLSSTTAAIHFENLRHIYRKAIANGIIKSSINPFGQFGFKISKTVNVKKGVPLEILKTIIKMDLSDYPKREKARDFWVLCFYLSGINLKDLLLLKHSQISKNKIKYIRAKTRAKQSRSNLITAHIIDEAKVIMTKYRTLSGSSLFFPLLENTSDIREIRRKIKNFNRFINQHMNLIGTDIGYNGNLSLNAARHSFATITINQGGNAYFLKEAMGHSSFAVTEQYIKGLDLDLKADMTEAIFKSLK